MPTNHRADKMDAARGIKAEKSDTNPFIAGAVPTTRKYVRKAIEGVTRTNSIGEEKNGFYDDAVFADNEQFIKWFKRGQLANTFLGSAGRKVLAYVLDCMRTDNTAVHLVQGDYVEMMKEKPGTYYVGLNELMATQFLAPSNTKNVYFINPSFIFSGNRLNMRHEPVLPPKKPKP